VIHVVEKPFEGRSRAGSVDRLQPAAQFPHHDLQWRIRANEVLIDTRRRARSVWRLLSLPVQPVQILDRFGRKEKLAGPGALHHSGDCDAGPGYGPFREAAVGHFAIARDLVGRRRLDAGKQFLQEGHATAPADPGIAFRGGTVVERLACAQERVKSSFVLQALTEVIDKLCGIRKKSEQRIPGTRRVSRSQLILIALRRLKPIPALMIRTGGLFGGL
jgi:hypothetical protein